jgi:amino acid adenylation domain-containing protein
MNTDEFKKRLEQLSPAKRALLEKRLCEAGRQNPQTATIPRAQPSEGFQDSAYVFPSSFAQQRLWFLQRLDPESYTYNISTACRLSGELDVSALQKSFDCLLQRHEVLRTTFSVREGDVVQIIHPASPTALLITDLRELEISRQEETLGRLLQDRATQPFNLAQGPLFKAGIIHVSNDEHVLHLNMHHIISDGWSMDLLFKELSALYNAHRTGKLCLLPELPIQYADYAIWQRNWLMGEELERQLSYWKKHLENLPTLQLPTDRPRPPVQTFRGSSQTLKLSTSLTEGIKAIGQRERATLFMTLLAAFQTLLYRYCEQQDISVGTPIAGRTRQETEGLIGFFVNTLVLRTNLSNRLSFRQLLARVRQAALEAYDHQDIPFEKLVEELNPKRSLTTSPLFQVMFVFESAGNSSFQLENLSAVPIVILSNIAKFDLSLIISERQDFLRASFEYNTDLFEAATIERMVGHFQLLLEGIVANPDQPLSELPLLTEAERRQLLVEWNDTKTDYAKDRCIHQLFKEQVERTPDAVALVFEDQQVTYRELNRRVNPLADYLVGLGVGPETLVGLCLERSIDMIVGLLGILKAGGAYLPLDPSYPKDRLEFMLQDANASIILTQKPLASLLPAAHARLVFLDAQDWQANASDLADESSLTAQVNPDQTAYVIYTSGSSGTPKGTMVTHYNVVRLFQATKAWFGFDSNDTWTLFHSSAFDFSVWEIWGALLHGGKLVIVPREIARSPQDFAALLVKHQVTVLNQTPSAFRQLIPVLTADNGHDPIALRYVIFGGEALELQSLIPWFDHYGDATPQLINMYGITETTVHVTYRPISRADAVSVAGSVIGKPIPDLRVYLFDRHRALVPIGVAGEIYVGGGGVAKGYLGRAELTAERFVVDPFSNRPGAKLYRSGDLARWLPNGELEYLGRIDDQVKIRGYRIELGEIEAVLGQHPSIQHALVLAREDTSGDKQLAAYLVTANGSAISNYDLRRFVQQKLPDYMVPSAFIFLDSLPLTANGKVDRKALPGPDQFRADKDAFPVARDELELQLTQLWERLLRKRPIGLRDNFFELGGHSLLAVRLISQVEKLTGRRLSLMTLFQAPTIEEQAKLVRREGWSSPWSSLVAIQPGGSKPPFFCVHAHDGNVLFWRELSRRLGPDQPFYGLQAHGLDGKQAPDRRVEDMASRYVREIQLLQPEGPYFLGGHCLGGLIAFEMAQQLQAQGQRVALLALMDSFAPLGRQTMRRSVPLRHRIKRTLELITLHIDNLRLLGWGDRLSYIEGKFNNLLYKIYMSVGAPWVPAAQARRRILDAGVEALRSYRPKVYPGAITLFQAIGMPAGVKEKPQDGWAKLAAGGLETYLVPGYFAQMVYEPRVQLLADQLRACLDKALADKSETVRSCDPAVSQSPTPVRQA